MPAFGLGADILIKDVVIVPNQSDVQEYWVLYGEGFYFNTNKLRRYNLAGSYIADSEVTVYVDTNATTRSQYGKIIPILGTQVIIALELLQSYIYIQYDQYLVEEIKNTTFSDVGGDMSGVHGIDGFGKTKKQISLMTGENSSNPINQSFIIE